MKKKLFSVALALTLMTCLFAGCGNTSSGGGTPDPGISESVSNPTDSGDTQPSEPTVEPVTLNVAYMPNYAALWAVTTADAKGYFAEEGITVNLVEFADGPTEIAAMESGSIDVSYIGPGAHRLCSTGNANIFLIQQLGDADCVIGFKSHGVESLADLKGKTIAYSSGTSSETILNLALDSVGLTANDVKLFDMDPPNMVTAALSGSVDACATWSPYSLNIMAQTGDDAIKFCSNVDFSDVTVTPASWVCTPSYGEANKDVLVRFIRAMYKAMDYGSQEANFEEVAGYVADQCKIEQSAAYDQRGDGAWMDKAEVLAGCTDGKIIEYYTIQQQGFINSGALSEDDELVAVNDFVLLDLMQEAGK